MPVAHSIDGVRNELGGIALGTVYKLIEAGLPTFHVGGRVLISDETLRTFVRNLEKAEHPKKTAKVKK